MKTLTTNKQQKYKWTYLGYTKIILNTTRRYRISENVFNVLQLRPLRARREVRRHYLEPTFIISLTSCLWAVLVLFKHHSVSRSRSNVSYVLTYELLQNSVVYLLRKEWEVWIPFLILQSFISRYFGAKTYEITFSKKKKKKGKKKSAESTTYDANKLCLVNHSMFFKYAS